MRAEMPSGIEGLPSANPSWSGRPDHRHSPIGESERGETDGSVEPNHGAGGARGFARDRISARTGLNPKIGRVTSYTSRTAMWRHPPPGSSPMHALKYRRGLTGTLPRTRHGPARPDHRRSHIGESEHGGNDGSIEPNDDGSGPTVFQRVRGSTRRSVASHHIRAEPRCGGMRPPRSSPMHALKYVTD